MKPNEINSEKQVKTPIIPPSDPPSNHDNFGSKETAGESQNRVDKGDGSIPITGIPPNAAGIKKKRMTRAQLEELQERLTARDSSVLEAIQKYRFMTSSMIGRLYFNNCTTKTSKTRNQNLLLKRLADHGLIRPLKRRIGGSEGGSNEQIWHLTEAGYRLLVLNTPSPVKRKRFAEPSVLFLSHTLAIAECAVQLTMICQNSHDLTLEAVDTEPTCWRKYKDNGRVNYLKPDIFVISSYSSYEDHWFMEMDLGTESAAQIVDKCNTYIEYFYTGIEQKETGLFPVVVWIVKDEARKEKLREIIRENLKGQPKMFLVIRPDELEGMLRQYINTKELL